MPRGAKLGELVFPLNAEQVELLDRMLADLYDDVDIVNNSITTGLGDVVGPNLSSDAEVALFDGPTGKLLKRATGSGVARLTLGVLSVGVVSLTSEVSGNLPFANLEPATAASKLLGRGSAGGGGDFEEISLGVHLTMDALELRASEWSVLTNGDPATPELIFDSNGDVIMTEIA